MQIHLIETANNFTKLREKIWECGWWKLEEEKAKKLIGGQYLFSQKALRAVFLRRVNPGLQGQAGGTQSGQDYFRIRIPFRLQGDQDRQEWLVDSEKDRAMRFSCGPQAERACTGLSGRRQPGRLLG